MQSLRTSESQKTEDSDSKPISVQYVPFKKRKIFTKLDKLRKNGNRDHDRKGGSQNLGYSPTSKAKETEKQFNEDNKEESQERKEVGAGGGERGEGRRGVTDAGTGYVNNPLKTDEEKHLERIQKHEEMFITNVATSMNFSMIPLKERSQGTVYDSPMETLYRLPSKYRDLEDDLLKLVREILFIEVTGDNIPPPILNFEDVKLPRPILKALKDKNIRKPTKIQMQGLPAVLLGRDLIGVSSTGSGKTLVFVIPMIMQSWEMERRMPIEPLEGPFGLVICPSRELATQITEILKYFTSYIRKYGGPRLDSVCVIGGTTVYDQQNSIKSGVHMIVATPGRLSDLLNKKVINLSQCRYLCFDEADRLIDSGFEDELRSVFDNLTHQRQTLLFSATMPKKIQEFARSSLTHPIVVSVGLSGSANKNVRQVIIPVSKSSKLPKILECIKKTPPPVLIFCENKADVDVIHEYLLLKGLEVSSIHGGLSQEDRNESIANFRRLKKDVLIGTDVASKGLDFPSVQHVINFDLPKDIENYIHRIGRTGRGEEKGLKTRLEYSGLATTLLDGTEEDSSLKNLKSILIESNQEIPQFLEKIHISRDSLKDIGGLKGCAYCGGLGHRISNCPKLESERSKQLSGQRDLLVDS